MRINKNILSVLIFTSIQINQALAYPEFNMYTNAVPDSVNVSGPADRYGYGTVIVNSGSMVYTICNSKDSNYTLASIVYEPVAVWSGRTYQATSAHSVISLFESGVPGFSLSAQGGNQDDGYPANWMPMSPDIRTVWTGSKDNSTRLANGHRVSTGMYVYKDETRFVGNAVLPQQTMYRYLCKDPGGITQEVYNFNLRPINLTGSVTGCTPDSSAVVLDMDKIAQGTIENAGSSTLIGTIQSTFSLKCDPNINVSISVVDLSDAKNVSDTASLTADSTASGVGFAVTGPSGTRLQFGPDGSSSNVPGQTKYFIQNSGTSSESRLNPVSTRLGFSYVRKSGEDIKPGTAKAIIGLTYSYQ